MAQKKAVSSVYLQEFLLSKKEILAKVETREHIFEMQDETGASVGFISMYDLKAFLYEHEEESLKFKIKNIDQKIWMPIFEHLFFQRRRPQLVSAGKADMSNALLSDDQEFFVLKHGQKIGPFMKTQLASQLEEKTLLLTDMISSNGGHTWMKLFQVEGFDRRSLKDSEQLPGVPSEVITEPATGAPTYSPQAHAITGLAYLSNLRKGKSAEKEKIQNYEADTMKRKSASVYKIIFAISIVGIGYFIFHIFNQLDSPFKPAAPMIGEQAEMLTPVEMNAGTQRRPTPTNTPTPVGERRDLNQVNDQGRSFETRTLEPIRPIPRKSFMETSQYQEIRNNEPPAEAQAQPPEEDPNYYYDNAGPMELDPVRSQVSKENYDNSGMENEGPIPSNDALFENEVSN